MKKTVFPAKVSRPRISNTYFRKRLFLLLNEGMRHKAIWVGGPPGSGKTTLVSSYIESKNIPCIWYQVDSGDTDPATFFHYLALAVKGLAPGRRRPLPHFTPEYTGGLSTFARNFFHEMFRRLPDSSLLVLDNFQEASGDSRFLEILYPGLQMIPDGCCAIMISRNTPPAFFARACVNQEMKVIGRDELRLTDEEFSGITKVLGYAITSSEDISHLQKVIMGWTAGLILMIERHNAGIPDKQRLLQGADNSRVFDYFMKEIMEKTNPETQRFLMETSFFHEMTGDMAKGLTGNKDSHLILRQLDSQRFFVYGSSRSETVYQYHPLFREFLQSCATVHLGREALIETQKKAAHILKSSGYMEDAAGLFIGTGEWKGMRGLIIESAASLISQGRLQVIESWLKAIPSDILNHNPWLLYYLGKCRLPQNPVLARKDFEASYRLFKTPPPSRGGGKREETPAGLFLSWSAIVETFLFEWKDFKPLDYWIEEFEWLLESYPEFPSHEVGDYAVSSILGALIFRQPQHPRFSKWEGLAWDIVENSPDADRRFSIGCNLILCYLWTGNPARAGSMIDYLASIHKSSDTSSHSHLMFLRSTCLYHGVIGSYQKERDLAEEGLRIAEKTGIHLIDVMFLGQGIYGSLALGEVEKARNFLERMSRLLDKAYCYKNIYYHHQASRVALHEGNLPVAIGRGEECLRLSRELGCPFIVYFHLCVQTIYLIEAGRYDTVPVRIEESREGGERTGSFLITFFNLLGEALLALKRDDIEKGLDRLAKALVISKVQEIRCFGIILLPASTAFLCAKALEAGIEVDHVRGLIRQDDLTRFYTPDPSIEAWPWPVRIYTLGRFEIWKDDRPVEFSRKAQKKPLAVLKILIASGGKDVPEEELIDHLWPGLEGDMATRAFATALYRLRKLIGNDQAILYKEGLLNLNRQYCWVDVWGFDSLLRQSEEALKVKQGKGGVEYIRKALVLYGGDFLPENAKESWTLSQRERLRNRFILAVCRLGQSMEDQEQFEAAIDYYHKGLGVDELAERLYQRLLHVYKRTGNRSEAIRAYRRCKAALSIHLGIEPSAETEAIYRSLLIK